MQPSSATGSLRSNLIGLSGAALVVAFFLSWIAEHSGFGAARQGGWNLLLVAIPLTGAWAACEGFSRRVNVRLAAITAAAAVFVPLVAVTLWKANLTSQIAIVGGVVLLVCGAEGKAPQLALPSGLVLGALSVYFAVRYGIVPDTGEAEQLFARVPLRFKILGVLAYGLVFLAYAIPVAAAWLIVAGALAKGRATAMIFAGALVVGIFTYATIVAAYGIAALMGQSGLWITGGAGILLFVLALLPSRAPKRASES